MERYALSQDRGGSGSTPPPIDGDGEQFDEGATYNFGQLNFNKKRFESPVKAYNSTQPIYVNSGTKS